jgi:hypothetical protein
MVNNCTNTIKMNNYHLPQIFNKQTKIDNKVLLILGRRTGAHREDCIFTNFSINHYVVFKKSSFYQQQISYSQDECPKVNGSHFFICLCIL